MEARETRTTCGPMYLEALEKYAGDDASPVRVFAAGFVSGQAEKVYLGACRAAMFRPSEEYHPMMLDILHDVATRYDLRMYYLDSEGEFWLCRDADAERTVRLLESTERNSAVWHAIRARLCGIPREEVDTEFHERRGYAERCD